MTQPSNLTATSPTIKKKQPTHNRKARGPYMGRTDYTLATKQTRGLLTAEEKAVFREYAQPINRACKLRRSQTIEGRANNLFYDAKTRAQQEAIPFTITQEWIEEKLRAGICEVTRIPFDLTPSETSRANKYAPSLDKINPRAGYTEDNTRLVVWIYNLTKSDYTDAEVREFCSAVANGGK